MTVSNSDSFSLKLLWSLLLEGPGDREPWTSVATPDWAADGSHLIVSGAAFFTDCRRLFIGSDDHRIRVWNIESDQEQAGFVLDNENEARAFAFSPD